MRCLFVHTVYCFLLQGTKTDLATDGPLVWTEDSVCNGENPKIEMTISKCENEQECEQECKTTNKLAGCCEWTVQENGDCSCSFLPGAEVVGKATSKAVYIPEAAADADEVEVEPEALKMKHQPEAAEPEAPEDEAAEHADEAK